jgi:mannitol-1-/sugar-/sorbitol-6-/2-deoxyglucose-6-phosphatase
LLEAVIFDMDGLLIDSEPLWVRAEVEVFKGAGLVIEEADCAKTKGLRVDDVIAYWQKARGFDASLTNAEIEERLITRVIELVRAEGLALRGIARAIAAAKMNERRIALASSSPPRIIEAALARLGLESAFDVVQSAKDESHGKPHPAIFLRTAQALNASPLGCVVIEDSMNGVIAAKAARMACIAVPFDHPKHEDRFALADVVIASLEEVTNDLLEQALATSSRAS